MKGFPEKQEGLFVLTDLKIQIMRVKNILETIGNTPHVRINRLYPDDYEVWMKVEKTNPGGSIKDRIALSMVEDAEKRGILKKGSVIIEPTSGNTGIGLALVATVKGYRLILTMPESMSIERRKVLLALGAELVLTPREKGMKGAIARAEELANENENSWIPLQFDNPANIEVHRNFTAQEILADFPEGFDYLITGVGTGGHISGVAEVLKKKFPNIKVFAVEPEASPVISGGAPGPHPIQGIGAGFIPKNLITELLDGTIQVTRDEAFEYTQKAAKLEGLFVGISSGASLAAVAKKIKELPSGSRILTFSYDHGERYLSVEGLF
jgi:cysteine synthase